MSQSRVPRPTVRNYTPWPAGAVAVAVAMEDAADRADYTSRRRWAATITMTRSDVDMDVDVKWEWEWGLGCGSGSDSGTGCGGGCEDNVPCPPVAGDCICRVVLPLPLQFHFMPPQARDSGALDLWNSGTPNSVSFRRFGGAGRACKMIAVLACSVPPMRDVRATETAGPSRNLLTRHTPHSAQSPPLAGLSTSL